LNKNRESQFKNYLLNSNTQKILKRIYPELLKVSGNELKDAGFSHVLSGHRQGVHRSLSGVNINSFGGWTAPLKNPGTTCALTACA